MNKLWSLALAALLLAACNNNNTSEPVADEGTAAPTEEVNSEVTRLQHTFPDLFAYMAAQDSSFAPQQFQPGSQNKIETLPPLQFEPAQIKPFEPFLIFNSDSSRAIDLYSYNYIITRRNGQVNMEEAGPDTEIALIDMEANTRRRIFFSGPSVTVFEAKWNGDNEIIMAGAEQLADNQIKPIIWQYNLTDSVMQTFTYDEAIAANMRGYVNSKKPAAAPRNL